MNKSIVVLSLFDGISCGLHALKELGIPVRKYYASEIDKNAIEVSRRNHPEIIHLGDVEGWKEWDIEQPDLIIGGSPCQGFSVAGKKLAFDDPRSKLFFTMSDIIDHYDPKYRFLENVRMKKEFLDIITEYMECEPILINSALVSAQNRHRYYWANWDIPQPEDRGILLKDIVHENEHEWVNRDKSYCLDANYHKGGNVNQYFNKKRRQQVFVNVEKYIVPLDKTLQILDKETEKGKIGHYGTNSQGNRVYSIHGKSVTLCGEAGGKFAKTGGYLFGTITPDRVNKRQNGQRFSDGKKFYTLTAQDKHGVLIEGYVRKLTPVECERLQGLPDGYTEGVSDNQRYKMLGNGWQVDTIKHCFSSNLELYGGEDEGKNVSDSPD